MEPKHTIDADVFIRVFNLVRELREQAYCEGYVQGYSAAEVEATELTPDRNPAPCPLEPSTAAE